MFKSVTGLPPMNRKPTAVLVFLSFLLNCAPLKASPKQAQSSSSQGRAVEVGTVQDPDEYAVWSVVLSKKYASGNLQRLVIKDRTSVDGRAKGLRKFEHLSEAVPDIRAKNEAKYGLENRFSVELPCILISAETENRLFPFASITVLDSDAVDKIQKSWHQFYQQYPGAQGVLTISRVGFNSDKSEAAVYMTNKASLMMGAGKLFLLVKKNGLWEIQREELIWFS